MELTSVYDGCILRVKGGHPQAAVLQELSWDLESEVMYVWRLEIDSAIALNVRRFGLHLQLDHGHGPFEN